jgi:hypothetical protein
MNPLFDAALEIQQFLARRGWRFCIIGGLAAIRWGEPQATQDVDISLLTGFGKEREYVDEILRDFQGRTADAANFAVENRVLLIRSSNGRSIDIGLAGIPFEERMIERASTFTFAPGISLLTCSAEDLVILKAFAGRPRDWTAVEGVVVCQAGNLDWDYIHEHLAPLCELKEDPDTPVRLEQLRQRLADS